jgi:serine protease Do
VSAGIISARGRTIQDVKGLDESGYYDFLQTDASINPGNSGGPLCDMKGRVVGINTAIAANGQGIGFAIPINMVKQLMPMLLKDGHFTRSALGVVIRDARDLSPEEHTQLKIAGEKGAVIQQIEPGGPAEKAKIDVGDVIVGFEGKRIRTPDQLIVSIRARAVGDTVSLKVQRDGKELELQMTLEADPAK